MQIIEIATLLNGAHRNQEGNFSSVPAGWAIIPDDLVIPDTFPFVNITVEDGIVAEMTAGVVPEPEPAVHELDPIALLQAQVEAQSAQLDFYEECIVEMAAVVYAE